MKYAWLKFLLFFILSIFLVNSLKDDSVQPVFKEEVSNLDSEFISINTKGLTTKNFFNYFKDTSLIVSIYPKVNILYKERIGDVFLACQRTCTMTDLEKYYKSILEKNNFLQDSILIDYYGVSIDRIIIYANKEQLNNLLQKCTICKTN